MLPENEDILFKITLAQDHQSILNNFIKLRYRIVRVVNLFHTRSSSESQGRGSEPDITTGCRSSGPAEVLLRARV